MILPDVGSDREITPFDGITDSAASWPQLLQNPSLTYSLTLGIDDNLLAGLKLKVCYYAFRENVTSMSGSGWILQSCSHSLLPTPAFLSSGRAQRRLSDKAALSMEII